MGTDLIKHERAPAAVGALGDRPDPVPLFVYPPSALLLASAGVRGLVPAFRSLEVAPPRVRAARRAQVAAA
jgi:hypothetical protein